MITETGTQIRARTARTSALNKPLDPVKLLLLLLLAGTALGAALRQLCPVAALHPLLTQGLCYTEHLRTLWDVFCTAALPVVLLLCGVLLLSGWGWGQPLLCALLLSRGTAYGIAAADCFLQYGFRQGFCIAGALVFPTAFLSAMLLLFPLRDALALSCRIAEYLVKSNADPEIGAKQHHLVMTVLRSVLLTVPAAGIHTALIWALNGRLPA